MQIVGNKEPERLFFFGITTINSFARWRDHHPRRTLSLTSEGISRVPRELEYTKCLTQFLAASMSTW